MPSHQRRSFLRNSVFTAGALALAGLTARKNLAQEGFQSLRAGPEDGGYGPVSPTASSNTGEILLALPAGFKYNAFGKTGVMMSDGNLTPRAHDGMGAFADERGICLIRNHEVNNLVAQTDIAVGAQELVYDSSAPGGTTTLIVDPDTRLLIRDFLSTSGTLQNCAGGITPWGSWITCEETTLGIHSRFMQRINRKVGGFNKNHGYCFEVPANADGLQLSEPLVQMGRFNHEAIAVDPETSIVYETEDANPSGFYRFIPDRVGNLSAGGRLQMLAIEDQPNFDTRRGQTEGIVLPVTWVDIQDPNPEAANLVPSAVFSQGFQSGGTLFNGLEGCFYSAGQIYFTAKRGGDRQIGQIWQYRPSGENDGSLSLLFESPDPAVLTMPDNICLSPKGSLLICEDGGAPVMHVRGLTQEGKIFDIVRDIVGIPFKGEFAGATFSPDAQTLFVNMQRPGITYAIWGPWENGAL